MNNRVDVFDAKKGVVDAMRVVEFDELRVGKHPPHLGFEGAPLLSAVEVLEYGKAALHQIRAEGCGLAIRQVPKTRLPHEGDRIVEQLRIVQRENQAVFSMRVEQRQLLEDHREMTLGARIVVVPG